MILGGLIQTGIVFKTTIKNKTAVIVIVMLDTGFLLYHNNLYHNGIVKHNKPNPIFFPRFH